MTAAPELREDVVSGDWVLVAPARSRRPHQFALAAWTKKTPKSLCPFEDPQKSGNDEPLAWYSRSGRELGPVGKEWAVQVISNKFPLVHNHDGVCPLVTSYGSYHRVSGTGFHEVVIPRLHTQFFAGMSSQEAELLLQAYQDRILAHTAEPCLKYVLVFHNFGMAAGASIYHPHSQIVALPIIPPDVWRSLHGAHRYYMEHDACVHCRIIAWELERGERIIYKNRAFVVIAPYASHVSFEMRIFPLFHSARFEYIADADRLLFADALTSALRALKKTLHDPAYNFFIHTAPVGDGEYNYYHWHLEILPKTSHWAGVELGTGIEVISMPPEEAAELLKKNI